MNAAVLRCTRKWLSWLCKVSLYFLAPFAKIWYIPLQLSQYQHISYSSNWNTNCTDRASRSKMELVHNWLCSLSHYFKTESNLSTETQNASIHRCWLQKLCCPLLFKICLGVVYDLRMVEHRCLWDPDYPEHPGRYCYEAPSEMDVATWC